MKLFIAVLLLCCAACGGNVSEVLLSLLEDGSKPCLGAARIELNIYGELTTPHHQFGQFFEIQENKHTCVFPGFSLPGLPFGAIKRIHVNLWDSTADAQGWLAEGESLPFNITEDSPSIVLNVGLKRECQPFDAEQKPLPKVYPPLGTVIVNGPPGDWAGDWAQPVGPVRIQYAIIPIGEAASLRSGFFSFKRIIPANPFPLIISGMKLPDVLTQYRLYINALDQSGAVMRTWVDEGVQLGPTNNPYSTPILSEGH